MYHCKHSIYWSVWALDPPYPAIYTLQAWRNRTESGQELGTWGFHLLNCFHHAEKKTKIFTFDQYKYSIPDHPQTKLISNCAHSMPVELRKGAVFLGNFICCVWGFLARSGFLYSQTQKAILSKWLSPTNSEHNR